MKPFDLLDIAFSALERRKDPPTSTDTAHKSYVISQGQEDTPHAGLGSVEASTARYFTVKVERGRFAYYVDVQAENTWQASRTAFEQNKGARSVQVVREIDRRDYERRARHS